MTANKSLLCTPCVDLTVVVWFEGVKNDSPVPGLHERHV